MGLSSRDRAILDFERTWWTENGHKAATIRERFGISTTRYYRLVKTLLEDPNAMEYDPLTVKRLRRVRHDRRRAKFEGSRADRESGK
jgi:hypothetical protein